MNPGEVVKAMENEFGDGFSVVEEVAIGDLTGVKKEQDLIPPSKDVVLRIKSASVKANKDNTYRMINLDLVLDQGITVGEQVKYKNKHLFQTICYYADSNVYTKDFFTKKQHLVPLKQLCVALGDDLTAVRINDAFLISLNGRTLMASIRQKKNSYTSASGERVEDIVNEVENFKKAPDNL